MLNPAKYDPRIDTSPKAYQEALKVTDTAKANEETSVSLEDLQNCGLGAEFLQTLDAKQDGTGTGFIAVSTLEDAANDYYQKIGALLSKADANGKISVKDATNAGISEADAKKWDANDGKADGSIDKGIVELQLNDLARSLHKPEGQLNTLSTNIENLKNMLKNLSTTSDDDPNNPTHKKTTTDEAEKFLKQLGLSDADAKTLAKKLDKDDGKDDGSVQLNRLANEALQRSTNLLGGTGELYGSVTREKAIEILMGNGLTREQAEAAATAAYVRRRNVPLHLGLGYTTPEGT